MNFYESKTFPILFLFALLTGCVNNTQRLHSAIHEGNTAKILEYMQSGADVNGVDDRGRTALHMAVARRDFEMAKILLDSGAEIDARNADGFTPLISLMDNTFSFHEKLTALLIERGANVNASVPDTGLTPLPAAVLRDKSESVKQLIAAGAELDVTLRPENYCPLHIAFRDDNASLAVLLLKSGAKSDMRSRNGETPLHMAADASKIFQMSFFLDGMEKLLESGADVNAVTNNGVTALHLASARGRLKMVEFLVKHGADWNMTTTDDSEASPVDYALSAGHKDVAEFLLTKIAESKSRLDDTAEIPGASAKDFEDTPETDTGELRSILEDAQKDSNGNKGIILRAGSMTAGGMTVRDMSCTFPHLQMFALVRILTAVAQRKFPLHECAPEGDAAKVKWQMGQVGFTDIAVSEGKSEAVNTCVAGELKGVNPGVIGNCSAVFLLGNEDTALKVYDAKFAKDSPTQ